MRYKVVIFDLDGTLLDTLEDLGAAVNHAMKTGGFLQHTMMEYRGMVGHGVRNLVAQALPEEARSEEQINESLTVFKAFYTSHIDVHTHPYPGLQELLETLNKEGVKMAVASNKFQSGTEYLVKKFFGGIPFVAILGNREGFPLKPDPEIVAEVLRKADAAKEDAVLVGDSTTDMKTAANGGIRGIAVSWGYREMADGTIASSAEELQMLL